MSLGTTDPTTAVVFAAQQGNQAALEELFTRYLPRIRQIVALRLGYRLRDFYEFEDIVQEALLNVFEKLDRFDTRSESRFRNWAATCVTNSVRQHFRKKRAKKRGGALPSYPHADRNLLVEVVAGSGADPERLAELVELADSIEAILLTLPASQRELIVRSRLCGMSSGTIAREMGFASRSAVRQQLSRALRRLEYELKRRFERP